MVECFTWDLVQAPAPHTQTHTKYKTILESSSHFNPSSLVLFSLKKKGGRKKESYWGPGS
jgi:hypothetical protein